MEINGSELRQAPRAEDKAKQSQGNQPLYGEGDRLEMTKAKPRRPFALGSIVYGCFHPVLGQVATAGASLSIADSDFGDGKEDEAKRSQEVK